MSIPRPEHPRPQFMRDSWKNINGEWSYTFDFGDSGIHAGRELFKSQGFDNKITVPFCPESSLSGVGYKDFIPAMWYHRTLKIPQDWAGKLILLHFGAVDYESEIFIDGQSAGFHYGGNSSFTVDITRLVQAGKEHHLVVHVRDNPRPEGSQAMGKQCIDFKSRGCFYSRITGIWQTVWLEPVARGGLKSVHTVADLDNSRFICTPDFYAGLPRGSRLCAIVRDNGTEVCRAEIFAMDNAPITLNIKQAKNWSPESPFLYDLEFVLSDTAGYILDRVTSYAGMRKIHIEGNRFFLNNQPLYQRLVLDQGFYPDGIWTAPSDEALRHDIELSMKAGFNGARLHQKVFEERFHYWADKLGYLTWGEYCSWGCDPFQPAAAGKMLAEWREVVLRDRNHPSIIAWTPWNESLYTMYLGSDRNVKEHKRAHHEAYDICKALDPTRPVNDASGYVHRRTDLWTVHQYEQNPQKLKEILTPDADGKVFRNYPKDEYEYTGQPYLLDEFGGIKWIEKTEQVFADNSWGYGESPRTLEELYSRLEEQVDAILSLDHICGYCYTQLTDVEQEQNGIYNYDRSEKFDMNHIARIFSKTALSVSVAT